MANTIIASLRDFFMTCPLMSKMRINVDYLSEDAKIGGVAVSIDPVPADEVIKRYVGGDTICQYVFVIRTVTDHGEDVIQSISNNGFYEALSAWLTKQARIDNLPNMPAGMKPTQIDTLSTGYLLSAYGDSAKYQIQCRLIYFREGER